MCTPTDFPQAFGLLSSILIATWNIPAGALWFAYFINRVAVPYGPLSMSWANEICGGDAEERALVLGIMNACGYAFNAWLVRSHHYYFISYFVMMG